MGVYTDYLEHKLADYFQNPLALEPNTFFDMTYRYGHGFLKGQLFVDEQDRVFIVPLYEPSWFEVMNERFKESLPYRAALLYFMEEHKLVRTFDCSENHVTLHASLKRKFDQVELDDAPKVFKTNKFVAISEVAIDHISGCNTLYVPASAMVK